jgi:hypothetical protein
MTSPHRRGFPCCVGYPFRCMPAPLPRRNREVYASFSSLATVAFPKYGVGRLPRLSFRGLLGVHCTFRPASSPDCYTILSTRDSDRFVASPAAPAADRPGTTPTRRDSHPQDHQRLCKAYPICQITSRQITYYCIDDTEPRIIPAAGNFPQILTPRSQRQSPAHSGPARPFAGQQRNRCKSLRTLPAGMETPPRRRPAKGLAGLHRAARRVLQSHHALPA